jgi:hypothetical protein
VRRGLRAGGGEAVPLDLTVIGDLLAVIGSVADASPFILVVTGADGVILWRVGAAGVRRRADDLGFTEGVPWTESTAARTRSARPHLWRHHAARLERLRRSAEHVVATAPGPLLIVDDHGWVAHTAGVAARDRVGAPREGTALSVPGMGLCLPERLAEGWLVRPAGRQHGIHARLVRGATPVLEVRGGGTPWIAPLTRRHAEILTRLHRAGPGGLSAGRLSRLLYGDDQHVVTVRAEVSRLRRSIGALVATNPYRLAGGVLLEVSDG